MKRNGDIKSFFWNYEAKTRKVAAPHEEQPEPDIDPPLVHSNAEIDIDIDPPPIHSDAEIDIDVDDEAPRQPSPNIHMQGHIISKGFHLIQGKGFLFRSTMLMIKMKFGDGTLQRMQSNHMDTTLKSRKCMVKIDTSTLFGLRTTNG